MNVPFVFVLCILCQLNILSRSTDESNFTRWTEDDWLEKRVPIQGNFMFNGRHYENVLLRTRMNQWSLELSSGNRSHYNRIWTELHVFFNPRSHSTMLNYSIPGYVTSHCDRPIVSPLTNESSFLVKELFDMDQRVAKYFVSDGFFRTINYMHCTIDDRRLDPLISIYFNVYFVTNREFQSLIYIEMSNDTQKLLANYQTRFYLHSYEAKFRHNFQIGQIIHPLNSDTSVVHMIKLYNQTSPINNHASMALHNFLMIFLNLLNFLYFCHL